MGLRIYKNIFFISISFIKKYTLNLDLIVKNHIFLAFNCSFFIERIYVPQIFTRIVYDYIRHTYMKLVVVLQHADNKK